MFEIVCKAGYHYLLSSLKIISSEINYFQGSNCSIDVSLLVELHTQSKHVKLKTS